MTSFAYFCIGAMAGMTFTLTVLVYAAVKVDKERKK